MKLAIVDLETTGGRPEYDRIIEFGVVLTNGGRLTKSWSTLINPERSLDPIITSITGISQAELMDAPVFADIYKEIEELISNRIFVAHNVRFDYSFLKQEFKRLGQLFEAPHLCSVRLSKKLYPEHHRHGLDWLVERFEIKNHHRHRALGDALVVWDFLQYVRKDKGKSVVEATIKSIINRPSLPSYLDEDRFDNLPSCPGVYIFYGEDNLVLYVGKSVNIKDRVQAHFYSDLRMIKELRLKEQIRNVETLTTAGEFSALLMESELVKKLNPIYNNLLKNKKIYTTLRLECGKDGYERIKICKEEVNDYRKLDEVYGIFKNENQARKRLRELVKTGNLCEKQLGLESGKGPCFGYHLQACRGACVGKEDAEAFNFRLKRTLAPLKILSWPFIGPVVIGEINALTEQKQYHVFDKWCHVGSVDEEYAIWELVEKQVTLMFEMDTYKILKSFLRRKDVKLMLLPKRLKN